jgi:hypothetical protein
VAGLSPFGACSTSFPASLVPNRVARRASVDPTAVLNGGDAGRNADFAVYSKHQHAENDHDVHLGEADLLMRVANVGFSKRSGHRLTTADVVCEGRDLRGGHGFFLGRPLYQHVKQIELLEQKGIVQSNPKFR